MSATLVDRTPSTSGGTGSPSRAAGGLGDVSQIVSFRLANEEYGVDIMRAQEIIMLGQITRMPEVPDFIRGLINLRGHVIPILDLRRRFNLAVKDDDEQTRIIVVNVESKTIGIVVDAVTEVLRISAEQIEPPPSSVAGIDHEYIRGLLKLENRIVTLLDIGHVLSASDQAAIADGTHSAVESQG
ncbi:MAG: chemotaxis protein CheW [Phycisphaerae bacterium]